MSDQQKIFLGLGSNLGERYNNLNNAILLLNSHPHIWIIEKSHIYQSPAMYISEQDDFYNMVIQIETNLIPIELLNEVKLIEKKLGRKITVKKNMSRNIDIDMAEAIMRVEKGSEVSNLSSKELKRDLLVFARNNPKLFLELADDENVMLRNFGIRAVEAGILRLSSDQRNFLWGSNGRKLMVIPFDEHPYTALAHWFKTDEGMEIYSNIEKRLNN